VMMRVSKKDYSDKYKLKGRFVLLHVGRLSAEKRVDRFIEMISVLKKKAPSVLGVVCSDGPLRKNLEAMAASLGVKDNIIFTGFVPRDELSWIYEKSSIVTGFGLCETFNICATEGLFYGKPLLLSDAGPHSEIIHNNGFLIKTGGNEAEVFAEKAILVYKNKALYNKMSRASLELGKKYDYNKVINEYEKFFKKAAKTRIDKKGYISIMAYISTLSTSINALMFTLSLSHKKLDKYLKSITFFKKRDEK